MAMGLINDDSFDQELSRFNGTIKDLKRGRGNGTKNVPQEIRKLVADEALLGANAQEIAEQFGISTQSVSAYKNGATSLATYNEPNKELSGHIDSTRSEITKSARTRLMEALESITPEKIATSKVQVASQIAKDMSAIIKNIEPQKENSGPTVQFVMYAPQMKKEEDFDTKQIVDVN